MNQYRYKCPTEGCEIDTILVNVHEDVIEYFGFCCPFCRDHMVRDDSYQSELDNADNTCDSGNAQKWVSLPILFEWMQSKGWNP
jgi:hypothetical protein